MLAAFLDSWFHYYEVAIIQFESARNYFFFKILDYSVADCFQVLNQFSNKSDFLSWP
jgi:c-di-AMP phosphodiesterase-like protein